MNNNPILQALFVFIAILFIAQPATADEVPEDIRASAQSSTLSIVVRFSDPANPANPCPEPPTYGSGFIISSGGYLLTAAHLFEVPEKCQGYTVATATATIGYRNNDFPIPITIVGELDLAHDVALGILAPRAEPFPFMTMCRQIPPFPSRTLYAFGFPMDMPEFRGLPVEFQSPTGPGGTWDVSGLFTYGFSGGPVVTSDGFVVGIIKGGLSNTPAVRWVVPIQYATDKILESVGNLIDCASINQSDPSEGDAIDLAGVSVLYVEKAADEGIVIDTLVSNKIRFDVGQSVEVVASNLLTCTDDIPFDAIRSLALALMDAGVQLKSIGSVERDVPVSRRITIEAMSSIDYHQPLTRAEVEEMDACNPLVFPEKGILIENRCFLAATVYLRFLDVGGNWVTMSRPVEGHSEMWVLDPEGNVFLTIGDGIYYFAEGDGIMWAGSADFMFVLDDGRAFQALRTPYDAKLPNVTVGLSC